jgi:hypothetical protein
VLDHVRAGVAYIAGRLISGSDSNHVYDYSRGRYVTMSGDVEDRSVHVYDYESRAYITGSGDNLYHYGERCHISLSVSDDTFTGYDYGTRTHFTGTVNGGAISLYDYQRGHYFNYIV